MQRSAGMGERRQSRIHDRWAQLRFSVIGQLLAAPPPKRALRSAFAKLAEQEWRHPATGEPVRFAASTIRRWYYRSVREWHDPVGVLRRKVRTDAGHQIAMSDAVRKALLEQYAAHKSWSVKLHHDNLVALAEMFSDLRPVPSYWTVRRFLRSLGLEKQRRITSKRTAGARRAEARLLDREVRSYEAEYVNGLWHWDAHVASIKLLTPRGELEHPTLFGVLDDRSRLACHLQWFMT
jgi:putative transposase